MLRPWCVVRWWSDSVVDCWSFSVKFSTVDSILHDIDFFNLTLYISNKYQYLQFWDKCKFDRRGALWSHDHLGISCHIFNTECWKLDWQEIPRWSCDSASIWKLAKKDTFFCFDFRAKQPESQHAGSTTWPLCIQFRVAFDSVNNEFQCITKHFFLLLCLSYL